MVRKKLNRLSILQQLPMRRDSTNGAELYGQDGKWDVPVSEACFPSVEVYGEACEVALRWGGQVFLACPVVVLWDDPVVRVFPVDEQ
jgi:hypothetical protein